MSTILTSNSGNINDQILKRKIDDFLKEQLISSKADEIIVINYNDDPIEFNYVFKTVKEAHTFQNYCKSLGTAYNYNNNIKDNIYIEIRPVSDF